MQCQPYKTVRYNVILASYDDFGKVICTTCNPSGRKARGDRAVYRGNVETFLGYTVCSHCGRELL